MTCDHEHAISYFDQRSTCVAARLPILRSTCRPKKLVSNEGHLLRMRMQDSQEVLAQKIAKLETDAFRLDVILYEPNGRCVLSTEDATRI